MNREFIDISATHRVKGLPYRWVKSIPAHNFVIRSVNGVTIATVERNYYLDTKANANNDKLTFKVRYSSHDCSNCSYDHLYTLFAEVYPGLFIYMGVCSEGSLTDGLERHSNRAKKFSETEIEEYRNAMVRYGA